MARLMLRALLVKSHFVCTFEQQHRNAFGAQLRRGRLSERHPLLVNTNKLHLIKAMNTKYRMRTTLNHSVVPITRYNFHPCVAHMANHIQLLRSY